MIHVVASRIIPTALSMLPPAMNSAPAHSMLLAIGLQESRFLHRRQTNFGPARGFWQFEKGGGVRGVMKHKKSSGYAIEALRLLRYEELIKPGDFQMANIHHALEHNDVLACVFARLLLYTLPGKLPEAGDAAKGWAQYLEAWRPGAPHPETWEAFYNEAWQRITTEQRGTE